MFLCAIYTFSNVPHPNNNALGLWHTPGANIWVRWSSKSAHRLCVFHYVITTFWKSPHPHNSITAKGVFVCEMSIVFSGTCRQNLQKSNCVTALSEVFKVDVLWFQPFEIYVTIIAHTNNVCATVIFTTSSLTMCVIKSFSPAPNGGETSLKRDISQRETTILCTP